MNIEEYYKDFQQNVLARAEANENFTESLFAEIMSEQLMEAGEIEHFDYCHFKKHGIRVDGYSFLETEGLLNLFIADFRNSELPEPLSRTQATTIFKRAENFFARSLGSGFNQEMEESSDGFKLAHDINARQRGFSKVRLYLLTNAELSGRVHEIESKNINGFQVFYQIWDISRLHRIELSGRGHEDIIIDFEADFGEGLPCLSAHLDTGAYQSFLAVIPGEILSKLYDKYGQRLLEQNVRTFLQFRGNINKGIRNTIINDPEMFFAYNNGITATAEDVVIDEDSSGLPRINKLTNLQIVNGGQTTASIFTARRNEKADLNRVFVQMKLSVIDSDKAEEVVPKISEYANSQNRINAADFFSNHPFHIRIEEFSRRLWASSPEGTQRETHWFYERARGQYANAQAYLTKAQKKEFLALNPRSQMFTKTDLAKFETTWAGLPHIVSLGAQKNFARYASKIGDLWEKDAKQFNELYFKELVAKAIFFRRTEKLVMQQSWYGGGYRANIVTYSLALLSQNINALNKTMNLPGIWKQQILSPATEQQIIDIARMVNESIQNTPESISNVTEWCKKEQCWKNVQGIHAELNADFCKELLSKEEVKLDKKDAKKTQKIDDGILAQQRVLELDTKKVWSRVLSWNNSCKILSPKEKGIVDTATQIPNKIPSEKQSVVLLSILDKVMEEGFSLK